MREVTISSIMLWFFGRKIISLPEDSGRLQVASAGGAAQFQEPCHPLSTLGGFHEAEAKVGPNHAISDCSELPSITPNFAVGFQTFAGVGGETFKQAFDAPPFGSVLGVAEAEAQFLQSYWGSCRCSCSSFR